MNHYEVKFLLDFDNYDYSIIEYIFSNVRNALNWQFDENFNANLIDEDINYQVRDVSNLEMDEIDKIIDSFFRFNFDYIINVPLYKFLVLKNNKGLKILANISSLIFDYSSINDFHALFVDLNKSYPKRDLEIYYSGVKDYLDSPNFKKDSQYWTKHITNSSSYVNFYNLKNNACNSQIINVDNDSVSTFIENHDCSLFDFYGCAFSLYLSRINRIGGSLLKTIIPGKKTDSEVFDKSTLLKIDVNNDDSFSVLLNGFRSEFENALNHAAVDVENYLDENASFYSIYDFNDFDENIRVYAGEYSALTLNIYGNSLELVYNSELFSDVYAEHMARNIECLINNVLSSPDQAISSVDILSDEEKALLSDYCSGKTIEVEKDKLFSEAFREHALANPDAIAVDDGINQVSYGELEKSSNSIANDLYENHNIGPGSRVALMLPRDYHFPELVLALNKIGAAYVPIDLLFPVNRIEHMLNISETEHLITKGTIAESLDLNVNIISIEDLNRNKDVDVEIISKIDDLFAILFTSGTTGIPKGVMFHNRQFPWFYAAYGDMFNVSPGDVIGLYASFSFVASFLINASMFWGGCIRLFNENEQKNSLLLTKALKETHINSLILPPTLGIPIFENEDLKLDYLILAGAKLNELSEKDRHTKLVNFYGTTEVIFAITKIYDLNDIEDDRVPVGRPIANTWTYILDENGNQMPIGVPGEICISSPAITQGYYNNPQSTSKVYVDNPYCDSEINKRMYRTGDIGFYNFDGEIEIIGREDDQLSVRGFRIESDEILTIMKSFEEISNIYLDVDNDNLIAYYTTIDDLDINEVKDALKTELPYYMIPSVFIELEKIPLNTNGKIDKSSLRVVTNNENIEITDEVISCVVDAFKEVLNQDVVLIDDDFVSLGGNSLSAMKLQLLLNERLDVSLSSNELIGLSTPQEIANHIRFNLNVRSTVDEEKYTFDEHCPLSESQLNVYLDESVNDMGTAYNNPFKIDFKDNYSAGEIKDALIKLFEAFPILKARVLNDGGVLSFAFDAEPEIIEGSLNDMHSFVRKFEFDKCLSRFLVADEGTSIILCADFHHLIFDGTSLNILLNKLASILDNEDSDFIDKGALRQIAFEEIIDSDYMDNAREFFDDMLADNNEVYGLLPSLNGTDEEFELIDTFDMDMEYLSSFLQNHSITYNQFFTSVFAYALSRFTGSDKVLFNIIEDGRGHIDLSKSVGMFVKTLPVLMDCKNQDINSYLKYSSNLINSVMKYDLYPFRILASDYDLNSNILFQYSHNLFSDVINKEDLKYSVDELEHDLNADLSFYIFNNGENRLTIRILYSSIYSKNFIEHFNQSYKLILNEMIRVGELKEIDYISNRDIELLDSYNQTKHKLAYDDILDAFNDNLSEYGDNVLVGYEDTSYTHGQGAFIANEVAGKLDELGVVKQDYVALFVNRSEWFLLASMGVLSMGGIYVPIDTSYPDERVIFMLEDTKSKAVLVDRNTEQHMKSIIAKNDLDIDVLNVSNIISGDISASKHLNSVEVDDEDIACVLYTSGTTGVPKGVLVTRKAINNFVSWYVDETNFTSSDVYGMHCSYVFDIHTAALYSPVISGGSLYVVPEDIRLDLKALKDYYVEHGCTHTYITSQVGKLFAESGMETTIKLLCFGGMKLGELNAPDSIGPFESYGPSENLAISTSIFANKRMHHSSIGRFISNVKGYVLDKELRRVPLGAVGELYLAGSQLTPGYLNRNEENDNAFFDNPFDDKKGYERIYKTGDMVRFLPDGTLGIVGRRDGQVKVRGNRVELTEVESSIRSMENVEDVTVQIIENNGNNELVAYIVLSERFEGSDLVDCVREHVIKHKPEYMAPSYVVKLDEIPLNVNGKVDKRALPDVVLTSLHADYVAPTTEDEKIIVEAFEKVFNHQIGIYDDFVHLGGDSLTAIRLLSYLGDYNITAVDILRLHTPYEIAKNIRKVEFDLDVYTLQSGCPLNESQLNVYLDIMVNNKDDAYIIPVFMEISKKYEINDIQNAINNILDVHPILSMCISDEFEVPYLVKGSKPSITVESNVDEDYIIEFANRPFDLNDSLCRFLIVNDNDDYKLFVAFNHIIFDGLSANVFKRDLQDILDGESISVDESFLKVSAFSQQMQNTDEYADAKKFYESMLTDNEETSTLMESIDSDEHGHLKIDLNLDTNLLKSFLDSHGVSENVLFTAAFAYTLSRFTGYENASFNLVENGRDRFNNFNSIGMYVNTLPVIVNCKNQDIASFMENMGSLIYDVMRYNYYPFRLLANEYNINSDILFQFMPEWIGGIGQSNDSLNNSENDIITKRNSSIADLVVEVVQFSQNYNLNIMYCGKYSKSFVEHFAESYKLILKQIINVEKLEEITYITHEDIEILDSYNQTQHNFKYNDILDAFNDNLSKYEDNLLVGYEDNSYTHGQGAFIANEVAGKLCELGVVKQDHVALFVNRSEWVLLASMGVLSAGGIYVPIDTGYPDERIIFMIEDTKSKVVIVDRNTEQRMKSIIAENDLNIDVFNVSDIVAGNIQTSKHLSTVEVEDEDIACVLYTSGTTGVPKGVLVTRKAINNFVSWYVDETNFTSSDVYGMHCSYVFDIHTAALYAPVITGGSLYVVPEEIRLDLRALNEYFVEHGCTHTYITSQVGKLFAESGMETTIKLLCFGGMKLGELNAPDAIGPFESYGPSENLAISTSIFANERIHHSSIGRFISNVRGYVLDKEFRRVPLGAVGELYLAGSQLTPGYLNRAKENDESFFDNPFDDEGGYERIYKTGDVVRFLPDGTLGIIGRHDSQVKIRGNRVELTEVESSIRSIANVEDVTVQTTINNGNNELVAYVVINNDLDGDELKDSICDHVNAHKPEYMVPSYIVKLDAIPLNVNGKVDKRALPELDRTSLQAEYVAPRNEKEKEIVEAFKKALKLEKVGIYDDFIRLGGDSLTAIRLLSYLGDYNITAVDILRLHTPYEIAKNIKKVEFDLDVYTLKSGCPLNESQLNVYLDMLVNNKDDAYIIPVFMEISKKYGINDIHNAINNILDVHPILSMCISDEFEVPYLVKGSQPSITVEDNVDEDYIIEFVNRPFDLNDSLCRFLIIDDNDDYKLFAAFNHIIFDGLSASVFKRDLQAILDGDSISVDDSFLKVSAFSQQIQNTDEYADAKRFYESMLVDNEETGTLMESIDSDGQGQLKIDLDLDTNLLISFLDSHGVSENVLFTAAFAYALSRFTGYDNASFNLVENGRDRFNNFNSIGMYVNTIPVIVNCKNQDVASFMENMGSLVYDTMRYNYYPFRLLANEYNINSDILFQFLPEWISSNEQFNENISLDNGENDILIQRNSSIADFIVEVVQSNQNYNLNIMYCDKYSKSFAEHFAESYKLILQQITNVEKLEEITYITREDIQILDSYNQTQHNFKYNDILDAFNDNLSKYEDNLLVGYEDNSYTHGQGAFIANEVAGKLCELGVVKQDHVALFVNRSEWVLLASMGVLSRGGIYVPIDTGYPDERVILMLEDTKSKVVIVDDDSSKRMKSIIAENDLDIDVLNVSDIISGDISSSKHLNAVEVEDEDIACVLYTSGTTGVPKGVLVTRKAINNFVSWYIDETSFTSRDVYGMHCSYVFDMHAHALYSPVISGGSLYVVPEEIRLDLKALNDYYVEHGCTHTYITSQVGKLFAESGMETTIKLLCFGGMKLGELNAPDSIGPFESYGPSENLAISTSIFANKRIHHSSIGRFISNVKGYVLDKEFRRVPLGAVGELYLAGSQLTPGYLNRAKENDNAFFDNPFDDKKGYERIYKTGDMVRFLPDGTLGIVGRRDGQVKVRGNRVELTEVESSIRSMENVEDVTVQTTINNGNNELVAYVVINNDLDGDELKDSICDYVNAHKPEYMVPSYVVKLDAIPLNVNGKVDKRALPEIDKTSLKVEYVAPRNENEKEIVEAFKKALNLKKVGIYDDFIRLGGDSLTAIRLLSYIESNDITMADIFTFRTPEAIAKNMTDFSFDLDIYSLESGCPLNAAQLNVFGDVILYNKKDAYHIPGYIAISKKYCLEDILNALNELLNAHPILSMHLSDIYEVNDADDTGNLDAIIDLIKIAKKLGIKKIMNLINKYGLKDVSGIYNMIKTVIRLLKGEYPYLVKGDKPPISVKSKDDNDTIIEFLAESMDIFNNLSKFMIVETEESYYLFYLIHHIIFDATSAGVFKHDFEILLDGGSVDFDDAFLKSSAYTHQIKSTEKFDGASEYYYPILTSLDDVGTLLEDDSSEGYSTSTWDLKFDKMVFKSFLNNAGISENVLFTSVFAYALAQFVDGDKVLFTMIENGRDRFNENFIGMTSNVMPLVADCKDRSINSFMKDMADAVYGISRHSYYPIVLLYQKYDFEVNILFQFVPNWIADDFNNVEGIDDIGSEEIMNHILNSHGDQITEFFVQIYQNGENYRLIITNSNKYSNNLIEDFKETYTSILSNIINANLHSNLNTTLK